MVLHKIAFNPIAKRAVKYKQEILKKISLVLASGNYLSGDQNDNLMTLLKEYVTHPYILSTKSGHDALCLALAALQLTETDEVILPANAYPTAFPVALTRCKLILTDVTTNGQFDVKRIVKKITPNTKVIIIVHLYGQTGDIKQIVNECNKRKIILIEDCAQAFGTFFKESPVGSFGDIACFSFYPTKNLAALGDGGLISTKHKKIYEYIRQAKNYGEVEKYNSNFVTGHSRLPEIQAAILNVFLKHFSFEMKKRKQIYQYYQTKLRQLQLERKVRTLQSDKTSKPNIHLFVIAVQRRDKLQKFLSSKGIETYIHYPKPVHLVPAFTYLQIARGAFPVAESLAEQILSLPFHPYMSLREVDYVVKCLQEFYV